LDVAEANFVKLETRDKLVPSYLTLFQSASVSPDDAVIFASSYMQDCGLYSIKQSESNDDLDPYGQGRQRINSGTEVTRRKKSVHKYEPLELMDSLSVICPMTDISEMPALSDQVEGKDKVKAGKHFIISSGNHVKSYLTLALDYVPLKTSKAPFSIKKNEE